MVRKHRRRVSNTRWNGPILKISSDERPLPLYTARQRIENDLGWRLGDAHNYVVRRRSTADAEAVPSLSEVRTLFFPEDDLSWVCCGYFPSVNNSHGIIHLRGYVISDTGDEPVRVNTDFHNAMKRLEQIALSVSAPRKIVVVGQNEHFVRRQFQTAVEKYGGLGLLEPKSYQRRYATR